jgi:dTDP-4-amino-4,6-dideoxygalactose transaminase
VHFIPIPLHPFYVQNTSVREFPCPQAMQMYERCLSLPLYPGMTDQQCRAVIQAVLGIVGKNRLSRTRRLKVHTA